MIEEPIRTINAAIVVPISFPIIGKNGRAHHDTFKDLSNHSGVVEIREDPF